MRARYQFRTLITCPAQAIAAPQREHVGQDCSGSRVRLPTTLSTRQKALRKQTESLQRRERRMSAISGCEQLRKQVGQAGCYAILTFQKTGDTNWTTSLTDFRKTVG